MCCRSSPANRFPANRFPATNRRRQDCDDEVLDRSTAERSFYVVCPIINRGDLPGTYRSSAPTGTTRRCRPEAQDALTLHNRYPTLPFHQQQLYQFQVSKLPYYLRNNDHFTMAIPVEQRFPFLDHRIVELGLQAPITYLFHNGWTKYLLRKAMEPLLPEKILWRREKMGFPFALERFMSENR